MYDVSTNPSQELPSASLPPDVLAAVMRHDLSYRAPHTDLLVEDCACATGVVPLSPANDPQWDRPKPNTALPDGGTCFKCGSITVRTGTCTTCINCGETGGCG